MFPHVYAVPDRHATVLRALKLCRVRLRPKSAKVFRGFTALIYSAVLVSFLYASEVEPHLMLAVPSLGLVFMPSTALLALKFNCFIQRLRFEDLRFSWAQAGESWVDAGTSPAP